MAPVIEETRDKNRTRLISHGRCKTFEFTSMNSSLHRTLLSELGGEVTG